MAKARVVAKRARTITRKTSVKERKSQKIERGEMDEDVYDAEGRELLEEADEIAPFEAGFAEGYVAGDKAAKCAKCGKILYEDFVEKEINGEMYRFCSDEHAKNFEPEIE